MCLSKAGWHLWGYDVKAKYIVKLETINPRKARKKVTTFTIDSKNNNRFYVNIDYWNRVVVDVIQKRWWEFWK